MLSVFKNQRLKEAGIPEIHAEAEANALAEVFSETLEGQLATKQNIQDVKMGMQDIKMAMNNVKSEVLLLKWMIGFNLAATVGVLLKLLS